MKKFGTLLLSLTAVAATVAAGVVLVNRCKDKDEDEEVRLIKIGDEPEQTEDDNEASILYTLQPQDEESSPTCESVENVSEKESVEESCTCNDACTCDEPCVCEESCSCEETCSCEESVAVCTCESKENEEDQEESKEIDAIDELELSGEEETSHEECVEVENETDVEETKETQEVEESPTEQEETEPASAYPFLSDKVMNTIVENVKTTIDVLSDEDAALFEHKVTRLTSEKLVEDVTNYFQQAGYEVSCREREGNEPEGRVLLIEKESALEEEALCKEILTLANAVIELGGGYGGWAVSPLE